MKFPRRIVALLLPLAALAALALLPALAAENGASAEQTTILFTHDMHSHFLPTDDGEGNTFGGYARL